MKNRIIAVILTLSTIFSIAVIPAGAAVKQEKKAIDIVDIWENGYPMPDVGDIIEFPVPWEFNCYVVFTYSQV